MVVRIHAKGKSKAAVSAGGRSLADARALVAAADASVAAVDAKTVSEYESIYRGYSEAVARLKAGGVIVPPKALVASVDSAAIPNLVAFWCFCFSCKVVVAWDCAASLSLVCDLKWLTDVVPVTTTPFSVGGVKDGVLVTHCGCSCYYEADVSF